MLIKPLSTWIKTNQLDGYTYYFDPESAMLAYDYMDSGLCIKSLRGKNVYTCITCGNLPQLNVTKTGKYFCTCPSSFIGGGDDCDPGEEYNGLVLIPKDTPVFDTISEAIEQWNDDQSCKQYRIELHNKIINKEITNWKQIQSYLFDKEVGRFKEWYDNTYCQVCVLCRLLDINISSCEAELFILMSIQDEKGFDTNVETLCKVVLKQLGIHVVYESN